MWISLKMIFKGIIMKILPSCKKNFMFIDKILSAKRWHYKAGQNCIKVYYGSFNKNILFGFVIYKIMQHKHHNWILTEYKNIDNVQIILKRHTPTLAFTLERLGLTRFNKLEVR